MDDRRRLEPDKGDVVAQSLGFIGLGSMGAPIARRLARSGFDVTGCDISAEMLEAFDEPGTAGESDPIETARRSEILGVCVRTDAQLSGLLGDGKIYSALGKGGILVLHSTVAPELAIDLARIAREHEVGFVDVGVSGGQPAALEGQLSLFVGGEEADIEKARPWLEAIGKPFTPLGPVGRGQQAKLLNNLISIANYGMSAAIVDIALEMGFEREQFISALNAGSAQSFALNVGPRFVLPREGAGAPGSFMGLHDLLKKDVDHCRELPVTCPTALSGLLAASDFMLDRIRRAATEANGVQWFDPHRVIDAYFDAVRSRDVEAFVSLFAEDAEFTLPNGHSVKGKAAIGETQAQVFAAGAPKPNPIARYSGPEGIAVEIETSLPDGSRRATTNIYRFDETGLIISLKVTMRSNA